MTRGLLVHEAFTGVSAFGRDGRAALARVLGCAPGDLDAAALGDVTDRRHRRAVARAIEAAAQPAEVQAALGHTSLAELAPGAGLLPDGPIDLGRCPPRLARPLVDERAARWSCLLAHSLDDLARWRNIGPGGAASLLRLAVERSLLGLVERRAGWPVGGAAGDVAVVLDHPSSPG